MAEKNKKTFKMPHTFVIMMVIILFATLLTWIIPAGQYVRVENADGVKVVDPNQFSFIDRCPVNPLLIPLYIVNSMCKRVDLMLVIIFSGGAFDLISKSGALHSAVARVAKVFQNRLYIFIPIMLPVCKPIIAVLALWSFVGMWNSYFDAMIYLNDANLQPLQLVLRSILVQNTPQPGMIADIQSTAEMAKIAEQLKYATIVVSSLPLLVMYPFFQKYFDKGIMVGSVKG